MKKFILIIVGLVLFTGCGNSVEKNIKNEKSISYDEKLNFTSNGFTVLDDNNFETFIGLPLSSVSNYFVALSNYPDVKMIIAIKPNQSDVKLVDIAVNFYLNSIKHQLESDYDVTDEIFINNFNLIDNCFETQYNNYYIYIISENNDQIFENLKDILK